ncbi:hypothetical protein EON77_19720, partial [bacterium]
MSRTTALAVKEQTALVKEALHGHGLVAPPPIHIESEAFTGSLAQLFRLAREARIEMREVMTLPICEAYFAYLAARPDASLDEAATALAILAYLVERKAWTLVPRPDTEPEAPEEASELVIPTPELYEPAVVALRQGLEERALLFFRTAEPDPDGYEVPLDLGNVGPGDLARAFERLLKRAAPTPPPPVARPRPSLQETMRGMLARLSSEGRPLE